MCMDSRFKKLRACLDVVDSSGVGPLGLEFRSNVGANKGVVYLVEDSTADQHPQNQADPWRPPKNVAKDPAQVNAKANAHAAGGQGGPRLPMANGLGYAAKEYAPPLVRWDRVQLRN